MEETEARYYLLVMGGSGGEGEKRTRLEETEEGYCFERWRW